MERDLNNFNPKNSVQNKYSYPKNDLMNVTPSVNTVAPQNFNMSNQIYSFQQPQNFTKNYLDMFDSFKSPTTSRFVNQIDSNSLEELNNRFGHIHISSFNEARNFDLSPENNCISSVNKLEGIINKLSNNNSEQNLNSPFIGSSKDNLLSKNISNAPYNMISFNSNINNNVNINLIYTPQKKIKSKTQKLTNQGPIIQSSSNTNKITIDEKNSNNNIDIKFKDEIDSLIQQKNLMKLNTLMNNNFLINNENYRIIEKRLYKTFISNPNLIYNKVYTKTFLKLISNNTNILESLLTHWSFRDSFVLICCHYNGNRVVQMIIEIIAENPKLEKIISSLVYLNINALSTNKYANHVLNKLVNSFSLVNKIFVFDYIEVDLLTNFSSDNYKHYLYNGLILFISNTIRSQGKNLQFCLERKQKLIRFATDNLHLLLLKRHSHFFILDLIEIFGAASCKHLLTNLFCLSKYFYTNIYYYAVVKRIFLIFHNDFSFIQNFASNLLLGLAEIELTDSLVLFKKILTAICIILYNNMLDKLASKVNFLSTKNFIFHLKFCFAKMDYSQRLIFLNNVFKDK